MGGAQRSASASFTAILRCFYGDLSLFSQLINRGELFNWQPWAFQRERWQAQAPPIERPFENLYVFPRTCWNRDPDVSAVLCLLQIEFSRSHLSHGRSSCRNLQRHPTRAFVYNWFLLHNLISGGCIPQTHPLLFPPAQVGREGRRRRPRPDPNPTKPMAPTGPTFPCRRPQFTHCLALRWTTTPTSTMTVEGKSASCRDNLVDCLFPVGEYAAKRSSEKHFYHC